MTDRPAPEPLLVITNRDAGGGDDEALDRALAVLRAQTSVEVCATGDRGELDGVLHRAGSRRIVVAGGDGSLHAVISALYRRHDLGKNVLGLLPLGTGNDFARGSGIPLEVEDAAKVVLTGEPRRMDLLVDELGEVVVNSVHVGAGAAASRRADRWKRRLGHVHVGPVSLGKLGYGVGAVITAYDPPVLRLRVEVDGETVVDFDTSVLMVAVGNGSTVGGGLPLTPEADPGDGKLDVMVSRASGGIERFVYAAKLLTGTQAELSDVDYLRGDEVSICGEEFYVSADGEVSDPERHRTWRLEKAAYSLLLPSG